MFPFHLGACLGVTLPGNSVFNHLRNCQTVFQSGCTIYMPTSSAQDSEFSTSLPMLVIVLLFYSSHPSGYEVVSHWSFVLHLSDDYWCWTTFHVLVGKLYAYLKKCLFRFFAHFLKNWVICLFIIELEEFFIYSGYKSFVDIWFANIHWEVFLLLLLFKSLWRLNIISP